MPNKKNVNNGGNVRINVILRRFRLTIIAVQTQEEITFSEYVCVALVIQHEKRMRRIISTSGARLVLPYFFFTLSHKQHNFGGGGLIEHKMCILIFSTTSA